MSLRRLSDNFKYTNLSSYRYQITLMQPSAAAGDNADGTPGMQTVFATGVWAAIRLMRQQEVNTAQLVEGEAYYDVRIPYMAGVTTRMNIISPNGENWFIVNCADIDQRGVELKIIARSENDGGLTTSITEIVEGGTF